MDIEKLRELYEDFTDTEIEKAQQQVNYILYDSVTGEVIQHGNMDLLAYESFEPYRENMEKMIIDDDDTWILRGEFTDFNTHSRMIKIDNEEVTVKKDYEQDVISMRLMKDGAKKEIIEADGIGGKEIIGHDYVQKPIKVEGKQDKIEKNR